MAKSCVKCGEKLRFIDAITGTDTCVDCLNKIEEEKKKIELEERNRIIAERKAITQRIIESKIIYESDIAILKKYSKNEILEIFNEILREFELDKELTEEELNLLLDFKKHLDLSNEEIDFDNRILPHQFIVSLRSNGALPPVNVSYEPGASMLNLKKGELIHFACPTVLKEVRVVNLGYSGGSHGVSLKVLTGVNYRIGSHRGHIMKEEQMVETSRGYFVITNKRILLNPFPGKKAVNIPLSKVLSYNCFGNGLELYKDGREKGFFFSGFSAGQVEVIGICLGHLLANLE